jgi:hypothetical protein
MVVDVTDAETLILSTGLKDFLSSVRPCAKRHNAPDEIKIKGNNSLKNNSLIQFFLRYGNISTFFVVTVI